MMPNVCFGSKADLPYAAVNQVTKHRPRKRAWDTAQSSPDESERDDYRSRRVLRDVRHEEHEVEDRQECRGDRQQTPGQKRRTPFRRRNERRDDERRADPNRDCQGVAPSRGPRLAEMV